MTTLAIGGIDRTAKSLLQLGSGLEQAEAAIRMDVSRNMVRINSPPEWGGVTAC